MANLITCIRVLCALILLFFSSFSKSFYVFYVIGGLSDALDGWVARRLGEVSDFGSRLDTVADLLFFGVVLVKMISCFRFPFWILLWVICIAVLRIICILVGIITNHKLVSEHSIMNKISGFFLFLIPLLLGIFPWQAVVVIVVITCIAATMASIQELFLIIKGKTA